MIHFYAVMAAAVLPYLATGIAKSRRFSLRANHAPREFLENRSGYQKRAHWAQQNSFEAFPIFAAAVIVAHLREADATVLAYLSITFVLLRVLYVLAYVADKAAARSIVWSLGYGICLALFVV